MTVWKLSFTQKVLGYVLDNAFDKQQLLDHLSKRGQHGKYYDECLVSKQIC